MTTTTSRIRTLNDKLRTTLQGGTIMLTDGIAALGPETRAKILCAVQRFKAFNPDNDPHGEHDFGLIEVAGERIMFKVDYYDQLGRLHSPDASDPTVTSRVLTIMLADEY